MLKKKKKMHHLRSARKLSAVRRGVCIPGAGWPLINMYERKSNAYKSGAKRRRRKKKNQLKLDGPTLPEISEKIHVCPQE